MPALLFLLTLGGAVWGMGQSLLRLLLGASYARFPRSLRFLWAMAMGGGVLAYGVLGIGLLGGLNRGWIGVWLALGWLLAGWEAWRYRRPGAWRWSPLSKVEAWLLGTTGLLLLFCLLYALAPPTAVDWDDLTYHLAAPKVYLRHGRIFPIRYDSHAHFPFTMEMLYTVALLFSSAGAAKAVHWSVHALAVLGLFLFGRRMGKGVVGGAAALVYASIPNTVWASGTAYTDLAQGFYQWLLLWAFLEHVGWLPAPLPEAERRRVLLPMGLLGGWALGIKMTALLAVAWVGLGLVGHGWRSGRRGEGDALEGGKRFLLLVGLALLVGSPWYLKSYLWTGDPFFPFGYSLFPNPYWSEERARQYRQAQLAFGHGRRLGALLRLPWDLTFDPASFFDRGQPPFFAAIGPAFLAFLPLSALAWLDRQRGARRKGERAALGWLGFTVAVWGLAWFLSMQYVRYLLPTLLVASLLVGWGVEWAWERAGPLRKGVGLLFALTPLYGGSVALMLAFDTAPVVFGQVSESAYVRARLDSYPAWEFVNTFLPPSAKVLTLGEPRCFYAERDYVWGEWGHSTLIPYERFRSAKELLAFLRRKLGVTHVLIHFRFFSLRGGGWVRLYREAWEKGWLVPLYRTPNGQVWVLEIRGNA